MPDLYSIVRPANSTWRLGMVLTVIVLAAAAAAIANEAVRGGSASAPPVVVNAGVGDDAPKATDSTWR